MSALRKHHETAGSGSTPPPEAFDYEDDVTPEAVKAMADEARAALKQDDYVVIDGYVGKRR
jgi:hypothetical protein